MAKLSRSAHELPLNNGTDIFVNLRMASLCRQRRLIRLKDDQTGFTCLFEVLFEACWFRHGLFTSIH